ncbi:MAG: UDP-N-acetylglucosamine diphosphorylase [Puniceicoccales bacterium]|jgi:NDP-sugar pyrophosphorylase family protein|nr:UDP-N-acetylglucosamine diphosphorylase [Puniceicoccales bacterium]
MMQAKQFFSSITDTWPFKNMLLLGMEPWMWLKYLPEALAKFFMHCPIDNRIRSMVPPNLYICGDVFIGENVALPPLGSIQGPAYIGDHCILRPSVYIRENVIVGQHCVLGNSCEFKHSILLDHVQVPHFNYVGDSILGTHAHLGAGAILSNVRFDKKEILIKDGNNGLCATGLKKLGAIMGDYTEVGCNAVLQPGTCLFPHCKVYPLSSAKGVIT